MSTNSKTRGNLQCDSDTIFYDGTIQLEVVRKSFQADVTAYINEISTWEVDFLHADLALG